MSCNHAHVNFKFQPKKCGAFLMIFSSFLLGKQGYCESKVKKFIMMYLSCLLQEKQGYPESKKILNYEMSFVYG
jgi:hypothetical protein